MSGVGVAGVLCPIGKIQPAKFLLAKCLANCIPLSTPDYKGRDGYLPVLVTDESAEKAGLKPGAEVDVIVEADSKCHDEKALVPSRSHVFRHGLSQHWNQL